MVCVVPKQNVESKCLNLAHTFVSQSNCKIISFAQETRMALLYAFFISVIVMDVIMAFSQF
jgi:hypothetical protein